MQNEQLIQYLATCRTNLIRLTDGELYNLILKAEQGIKLNAEQLEAIKMEIQTEVDRLGRAFSLLDAGRVEE